MLSITTTLNTLKSFLKRHESLLLVYLFPFFIFIFGNDLLGETIIFKQIASFLGIETLALTACLGMIPWLFIKEKFVKRTAIFLIIFHLSIISKLIKWLNSTPIAQYTSSKFGISGFMLFGTTIFLFGLLNPKTREGSIIGFVLVLAMSYFFHF